MPEPGSKKYDRKRAKLRKEAEDSGVPDQQATKAADKTLQKDPSLRSRGPRTTRGLGPKGERPESLG
ncbi:MULTISPECIES: hypothetical protein [Streptomyces]|uniref:Uncharacterized protein n=2 Tax=Streptomyces TaxID=1883 RepID=A0A3R7I4F0_9ACTN|nr:MULTISPECIES: hypothetical protein [Streptomyces]KNE78700.1 hypothetical protein ADZ36_31760 [Streptomyces fradiae]OFA54748.1 hypothetical protein BEN35_08095 [Streptomyces fradiae]PQM21261.1 hypothetical protein Sfr7A_22325 [Streptomyces xinghaiensis]RKM93629.1 hypothetical protein SFRA_020875 [Streptomyces xinghaiensis]RNC71568.1 hypothetical protein DC095_021845 [Streptomyces xinghaiensis]